MALPTKLPWQLANSQWAASLNPILNNPLNNVSVLKNVALSTGANTIDHKLGHVMQGWFIVDIDAAITYYRSAPLNALTLTLTCSGPATASIGVF